ncbi:MAG: fibronectin type III domain-containing protein, partial [Agitococcus sp.]|nr:fibronectin type III domain-containing protein [Agitococcus sp.]
MKNKIFGQSATVLLTAALLQACGGGGGGDSAPTAINTAPTNVSLVEASSAGSTVVTASWLPATDDSTTAANLNYEIHASTDPNFVPSASTLKLKGANLASARIDGLLPSTQYTLKLVVLDKDGLKTVSNSLQVTTSSTPSEQMAGVTVKTMTAGQTLAMTDTSLTLAAGAPVPNVGEFVASAEGDGYLRKVVAVNVVDGKTVLTTEQAALNEVLQKAELSSSFKIKSVPVEVAATPTQAGLMRVNDVTQPDHANFDWGNTGFKLNTTTYKADTNTPSQALIQAGLESVSASPSFSISSQTKTFDDGFGTFSQVTVPNSVSIAERATGEFKAVLKILSDDTEGPFWDRKNVPLTVCESELVKVVNEKGESVAGLVKFGALESVQSQSASGSVRVAHQVIKVDANFEKASEKPYVAVFKARVDEARDGCKSPSKEDFEYNVDIYVTSANDFPQKETSPLSFGKEFKVDNSITFTIDPVIESEVRLDNNLGPDTLSYARLELKTAPLVHQVLTINASASAKLDQTKTLFTRKFTKVYLAGQVPVVMVGEYGVDVRVDGEVTGAMDATETIDLGFSELSYGLVYQNGQYTTISKRVPEYSFTVEGNAKAKANLKVSLVPRLTVKFYGIATGKAYVEPYGLAEAGMEGHIKAGISDAGDFGDADYQLTEAQLSVGLDAYLYADLSVFKKTLVSFPEGKNQNTPYRELYKLEMLPNTKIMALPTLSGALVSAPPRTENSRSLLIRAKAENLPNPLTFLPPPRGSKPWIEFTNWTMPKVVFDAPNTLDTNGYKLVASDTTAGDFWFTY